MRDPKAEAPNRDHCPLCHAARNAYVAPRQFLLKNGFHIVKCPHCGLLWTRTHVDYEPAGLYTKDYFQGGMRDGYFDYAGSEPLLAPEHQRRIGILRRYKSEGELMEIGCATGGFLLHARKHYRTKGVDVSEFAVEIARRKGLDVSRGTFEAVSPENAAYDIVVMFDTIEHLKDPIRALRRIHRALRPGGILLLTTGDAQSASARLAGSRWRLLTPPQHLWFFGSENLSTLLRHVGLNPVRVQHPWRSVPLSLMWYQLFRGKVRPLPPFMGRAVFPVNLFDSMLVVAERS